MGKRPTWTMEEDIFKGCKASKVGYNLLMRTMGSQPDIGTFIYFNLRHLFGDYEFY